MKKSIFYSAIFLTALIFPLSAFAGGVWQQVNQSVDYIKVQARNASTDVDAVYFNPAGTALMNEGLYIHFTNELVYAPVKVNSPGFTRKEYKGLQMAPVYPSLFLIYNTRVGDGKLALDFALMPIAGGGGGTYNNGLPAIDTSFYLLRDLINQYYNLLGVPAGLQLLPGGIITSKLNAIVFMESAMANVAYSVLDDKLSFSLGYRFVYGYATIDAKLKQNGLPILLGGDYSATQTGICHGIIIGVSSMPVKALTIGVKAEYHTPMRMKTDAHDDTLLGLLDSSLKDGAKAHRQLPPLISAGIAYRINNVQLAFSSNLYLNQYAQWKKKEKDYTTEYEVTFGIDYTFKAVPINIGAGYNYAYMGARPSARNQMNEVLDTHGMSCGISYTFGGNLKITLAYAFILYIPQNVNKGNSMANLPVMMIPCRFYKQAHVPAFGIEYKIF